MAKPSGHFTICAADMGRVAVKDLPFGLKAFVAALQARCDRWRIEGNERLAYPSDSDATYGRGWEVILDWTDRQAGVAMYAVGYAETWLAALVIVKGGYAALQNWGRSGRPPTKLPGSEATDEHSERDGVCAPVPGAAS